MPDSKLSKEEKQAELDKYRALVLATLDYYIGYKELHLKTATFDSIEHYKGLKRLTEEHYQKGRLTRLKQWFRDLTEMIIEERDLKFNKFLRDTTNYDIDIFSSFYERVDKIIEKGRIITNNQFYDIKIIVDQLCQTEPVDNKKIEMLETLLRNYEQKKPRKPQ